MLTEIRTEGKKNLQHSTSPKSRDGLLSDIRAWKRTNSKNGGEGEGATRDRTALLSDIRQHMLKKEEEKEQ
eukprot:CAMPEP_0117453438 /NCGR_PEP_ID=MMETSP0759-20121206/10219_1 /TAXON_ID=63605 /ORGANISM="Percolomonas cosmopolitus, Strain WS" /LENGTH=70 /DNA_ID=CAMNT_0005246461 /DNA_START=438 /DNA_END=650 /DNA_ORIENTATION=+